MAAGDPPIPERYQVREELLRTEQLVRLRAFDTTLEQEVILEFPGIEARQVLASAGERTRMLRDARARAKVSHVGIQNLKTVIENPECPILVLDARTGEPLSELLERRGRLTPEETLCLGAQLADATHAVHCCDIVHRGIAAGNILLDSEGGSAVLTGFVFAKPIDLLNQSSIMYKSEEPTVARALPNHPAPEQIAGQPADARADVYALGCVLYECLTGRPAFESHEAEWSEPQDPRHLADMPAKLGEIVLKCVRRSPTMRYPTMLDVKEALEGVDMNAPANTRGWVKPVTAAAIALVVAGIAWAKWPEPTTRIRTPGPAKPPENAKYHARYDSAHAVLIGIDEYRSNDFDDLETPVSDIRRIRSALVDLGWHDDDDHMTVLTNEQADEDSIDRALHALKRAGPNDQVLVFFSGHGLDPKNRGGFVAAWDAVLDEDREPEQNCIGFERLTRVFQDCEAKHIMIALDCCQAGAAGVSQPTRIPNSSGKSNLEGPAYVVLAASTSLQNAQDRSRFADVFVAKLREAASAAKTSDEIHTAMKQAMGPASLQRAIRRNVAGDQHDFVFMSLK